MNRLFEALSEMEMLQPAAVPVWRRGVTPALSEIEPCLAAPLVVAEQPEIEEPSPKSSVIEFPQDMAALLPELPADAVENGVSPLLEESLPNDLASLIAVLQAEMDEMAAGSAPSAAQEAHASAPIPEFECTALAVEDAEPDFLMMEATAPIPLEFVRHEPIVGNAVFENTLPAEGTEDRPGASSPSPCATPEQAVSEVPVADSPVSDAPADWLLEEERSHSSFDEGLSAEEFPFGMAPLVLVLEPDIQQMELNFAAAMPPATEAASDADAQESKDEAVAHRAASAAAPAGLAQSSAAAEVVAKISEPAPARKDGIAPVRAVSPAEPAPLRSVILKVRPEARLVALSDPDGLGAEKFRALVTRLEHQHKQCGLRSFQVTSSVISEGKTLVSGNIALTLARHLGAKTLLVEGDLHRPTLASLFGLERMSGLNHWWSGRNRDLSHYAHQFEDMPLWFLPAGKPCDRPSDILRSARFVSAFEQLAGEFEWIVVDSTPMVPIVDVNLWSRIVDGTLLVAREGVTPVKALKQGLLALDHPNLIGMVLNDASSTTDSKYDGQYYGTPKRNK